MSVLEPQRRSRVLFIGLGPQVSVALKQRRDTGPMLSNTIQHALFRRAKYGARTTFLTGSDQISCGVNEPERCFPCKILTSTA